MSRRSSFVLWALSLVLGAAYAFAVLGPRPLNPLDVSWLYHDPATAYLGWAFSRQEEHLTLPLGWAGALGYPLGVPAAYFDSIPLLAAAGWLLRGVLPPAFQYFGLYFALCCVLQFYFGYRISLRLGRGNPWVGVLGGGLFLTAPTFLWRALGHFALGSHWMILAALEQLLDASDRPTGRRIAFRGALCFFAGSINPYIAFMTLLVLSGACLRTLLCRRKCLARIALNLAVMLGCVLVSLILFGFLRSGDASQYAGEGYESFSMNLLAPIDPQHWGALLLPPQSFTLAQTAGYNYLGLGLLVCGIVSIAKAPIVLGALLRRESLSALAIFIASLLLALSTLATAGSMVLYHVVAPEPAATLLRAFRASGRLFWPGYYLLVIGIIAATVRAFPGRWLYLVLGATLLLQYADTSSFRHAIHAQWKSSRMPAVSSDPAWRELGGTQTHLVVMPAWQCSSEATPGGVDGFAAFGQLALEKHMTINSFYAGRYSRRQIAFFCQDQLDMIVKDGLQDDTAYVFSKAMLATVVAIDKRNNYCRFVDGTILCSLKPGFKGAAPDILQEVPVLRSGMVVPFTTAQPDSDSLVDAHWWTRESFGRWMIGPTASMLFRVAAHPQRNVAIDLTLWPFVRPTHPHQRLTLSVNGKLLLQKEFEQNAPTEIRLVISRDLVTEDGSVKLDFDLPDAVSPRSLGQDEDVRLLSFAVTQLRVEDAGD